QRRGGEFTQFPSGSSTIRVGNDDCVAWLQNSQQTFERATRFLRHCDGRPHEQERGQNGWDRLVSARHGGLHADSPFPSLRLSASPGLTQACEKRDDNGSSHSGRLT